MIDLQQNIRVFAQKHQILPLIDVTTASDIVPIIDALALGEIHAIEITLRSTAALEATQIAREAFPDLCICVGTVSSTEQLLALKDLDINFFITPGINKNILDYCQQHNLDILPGIATPSDILLGEEYGIEYFKFFPAEAMGGAKMLKAFNGPFNDKKFCPTGGINENNFLHYLSLHNTFSVGGSWLASKENIDEKNWPAITKKATETNYKLKQFTLNYR